MRIATCIIFFLSWYGSVGFARVWLGKVSLGDVRCGMDFGAVRMDRSGSVGLGMARSDLVR